MKKDWFGKRDWRKWLEDRGLKKWFRRDNLVILVLAGVFLFLIAWPQGREQDEKEETENARSALPELFREETENGDGAASAQQEGFLDDAVYAASLEEELTEILSRVSGVGNVRVMITLSSSSELVVERERPVTRSDTEETDQKGGSRKVTQTETGDAVIYRSEGTDSVPYVIKTLPPRVGGVLVVAEGAGDITVHKTVTAIVQALFDVEPHKISVVRMK